MSSKTERTNSGGNNSVNQTERSNSVGINSLTSRSFLKRTRSVMQLAVFVMLILMFVMNLFRGTPNDPHTTQTLYKMLDMPKMAALCAPGYSHFPTNGTAN